MSVTPKWSCEHQIYCLSAILKVEDETTDLFSKKRWKLSPLFWRIPILLWAMGVLMWSTGSFWGPPEMYLLYMTHWGLLLIVVESMFGIAVALKTPQEKNSNASGLPWYVKAYWIIYNVTIPVAFLITMFYWGVLRSSTKKLKYAPNPVLDLMLHGINSVVMLTELILSSHPSRFIHIMQPLYFGLAYLLFTVVYYFAGGLDPWGNIFIYPVIDWSKPDQTMVVLTLTALFLALMHLLVIAIASLRDFVTKKCETDEVVYDDYYKA